MKRREFLKHTAATAALMSTGALSACGDSKGDTADSGTTTGTTTGTTVCTIADANGPSDTHNHSLLIPAADLTNPVDGNYMSTGGTHDHLVTLTAADLTTLATNCPVTVNSNDSHFHEWIITIP